MAKVIAIVPAAGRGTRLGLDIPKALVQPDGKTTLLEIAHSKLRTFVDEIVFVVHPDMPHHRLWPNLPDVHIVVQDHPTGMGDAIFCGSKFIESANVLIVVWADQYGISTQTISQALSFHNDRKDVPRKITIPLIEVDLPYVEYILADDRIGTIKQSREGDQTATRGLTDVGFFILDAGQELTDCWDLHLKETSPGKVTNERNFLPFLTWLLAKNWTLEVIEARSDDRLGINTQNDFEIAKKVFGHE